MKQLYNLIKSLSKSEKRYFSLNASSDRSLKYIHLFGVFETLKEYEPNKIQAEIKNLNFDFKYISDDVNYLYFKILDSLNNYNKTRSSNNKIKENLGYIVSLIDKGLIEDAQKIIKKTKKLILTYERLNLIFETIALENKVNNSLYNVKKIAIEKQKNESLIDLFYKDKEAENDYWQCVLLSKKWPINKSKYEQYLLKYRLNLIEDFVGNLPKISALQIHQLYYFLERDKEKELFFLEKQLNLIDIDFPLFKKEYFSRYIKIYSRKLYLDLALYPHKIKETVETFYILPVKYNSFSLMDLYFVKIFSFNFILEYYIRNNQFSVAVEFIEQQNFDIDLYKKYTNESFLISAFYKIGYCYYRNNNYKLAVDYCNTIDSFYKEETRIEVYLFNKLLMLFIHFDLKNYRLVENLIKSYSRVFAKNKELFSVNAFCKEMFSLLIAYQKTFSFEYIDDFHRKYNEEKSIHIINKYFDIEWWFKLQKGEKHLMPIINDIVKFDI